MRKIGRLLGAAAIGGAVVFGVMWIGREPATTAETEWMIPAGEKIRPPAYYPPASEIYTRQLRNAETRRNQRAAERRSW